MTGYDRLDDGQAEARAAVLGGKERIQQTGQNSGIKTRPGIQKFQAHAGRPAFLRRMFQRAANAHDARPVHGLLAVDQDIVKGPVQQILVPVHKQTGFGFTLHGHAVAAQFPFQKSHHLVQHQIHIHQILAGLARPGVVQKIIDRLGKANGFVVNGSQNARRARIGLVRAALKQFGAGTDDA